MMVFGSGLGAGQHQCLRQRNGHGGLGLQVGQEKSHALEVAGGLQVVSEGNSRPHLASSFFHAPVWSSAPSHNRCSQQCAKLLKNCGCPFMSREAKGEASFFEGSCKTERRKELDHCLTDVLLGCCWRALKETCSTQEMSESTVKGESNSLSKEQIYNAENGYGFDHGSTRQKTCLWGPQEKSVSSN